MRQIDGMCLMEQKQGYQNCILAFAVMGASALLMGFFFDFYFDMNDDTMMRDIMSGVYGGAPDGHNMQTLYPLGALMALCYQIHGSFPWYGAFLFLCQFGCFFLIGVRLCTLADIHDAQVRIGKLLCLLALAVFQWGIWLTHMVNVQYTITCGMLVGTAVFLFLTMPEGVLLGETPAELSVRAFLWKSLPALFLFLLAFHLRSEMALLTLPFLGLAGLFCWWEDRPVFAGKTLQKYVGLLLILLACMGLSIGADGLAYGGEWRTFRQFFDDRTAVYDFYPEVLPEKPFDSELESVGVSVGAQILLKNYNFGLDEKIDAQMLSNLADYAREHVGGARDWSAVFKEKLLLYRYRSFHGGDAPYNLLVILGYGVNIIAIVIFCIRGVGTAGWKKPVGALLQLLSILAVRSALWMFVLMRGRDPERITHPLYLVEFCLLAGLFVWHIRRAVSFSGDTVPGTAVSTPENGKTAPSAIASANRPGGLVAAKFLLPGASAALLLLSLWGLWKGVPAVQADQVRRQEINKDWEAIDAYCRVRPDTFYFEDVYSTVAFSGKLLERRDNTITNYDIVGGWMCKSPLYWKKLAVFGIESAADALAEGKAAFILSDEEESLRGLTWLEVPYAEKGLTVYVEECDRIGENYGVYQVIPVSETGQFPQETKREQ